MHYPSLSSFVHAVSYVLVSYRDGKLCTDVETMAHHLEVVRKVLQLVYQMVVVQRAAE